MSSGGEKKQIVLYENTHTRGKDRKESELHPGLFKHREPRENAHTDCADPEEQKIESARRREFQEQERKTENEPAPPGNDPVDHGCVPYHERSGLQNSASH